MNGNKCARETLCALEHGHSGSCMTIRALGAKRGPISEDFIDGYLAALGAVDRAIEDGEVSTLNEVRGFITEDAERMAK